MSTPGEQLGKEFSKLRTNKSENPNFSIKLLLVEDSQNFQGSVVKQIAKIIKEKREMILREYKIPVIEGITTESNIPSVTPYKMYEGELVTILIKKADNILFKLEIKLAMNGEKAFEYYRTSVDEQLPFNIILMDQEMPKLIGTEAIKKIRKYEENQNFHAKIIGWSTKEGAKKEFEMAKADEFYAKNITKASIEKLVLESLLIKTEFIAESEECGAVHAP